MRLACLACVSCQHTKSTELLPESADRDCPGPTLACDEVTLRHSACAAAENILIDSDGNAAVGDWGISVRQQQDARAHALTQNMGTRKLTCLRKGLCFTSGVVY